MKNNEIAEELLRSVWTDNRIDNDQFIIHKSRVEAIIKQLQNASSNCTYVKLPSINAIVDELNGGGKLGWTDTDVEPIIKAIKKLGNFA